MSKERLATRLRKVPIHVFFESETLSRIEKLIKRGEFSSWVRGLVERELEKIENGEQK